MDVSTCFHPFFGIPNLPVFLEKYALGLCGNFRKTKRISEHFSATDYITLAGSTLHLMVVRILLSLSPLPSGGCESSSDMLKQILSEVQKTSKEVTAVKASLNELDKWMAAMEQRETERSSTI